MEDSNDVAIKILEFIPDTQNELICELKAFILKTARIPIEDKKSKKYWMYLCDVVGSYIANSEAEWQRIVVDLINLGTKKHHDIN